MEVWPLGQVELNSQNQGVGVGLPLTREPLDSQAALPAWLGLGWPHPHPSLSFPSGDEISMTIIMTAAV